MSAQVDVGRTLRLTLVTSGVVLLAMGAWSALCRPEELSSLATPLGIGWAFCGAGWIVPCVSMRGVPGWPRWARALAVLDVVVAVVMLGRLGVSGFTLPPFVGAWMLCVGVVRVVGGAASRQGLARWWLVALDGLVLGACGVAVAASPLLCPEHVGPWAGAGLALAGAVCMVEARAISPREDDRA